jgi:nickel transport protein
MKTTLVSGMSLGLLMLAGRLLAHDIETQIKMGQPAVIVRATYAGKDPVAYAPVLIYAASERKTEFQNGRTDARGVFSFVPDRGGEWLFVVDDEMGHRREVKIPVDERLVASSSDLGAAPTLGQKILTGVALILGLTGLVYWYKARQME